MAIIDLGCVEIKQTKNSTTSLAIGTIMSMLNDRSVNEIHRSGRLSSSSSLASMFEGNVSEEDNNRISLSGQITHAD